MKKKILILLMTVYALVLGACGQQEHDILQNTVPQKDIQQSVQENAVKEDDEEQTSESEELDISVTYEYQDIEQMDEEGNVYLYAGYMLPVVTIQGHEELEEKMNAIFEGHLKVYDRNLKEMDEAAQLFYEETMDYLYYDVYAESERIDSNMISICMQESSYNGGMHGDSYFYGLNIDPHTGALLALFDLSEDEKAWRTLLTEKIIAQAKRYDREDSFYYEAGSEEFLECVGDVLENDSWYFTKSGLCIIANPYLIGPYASGTFRFLIPYEELEGLKVEYQYQGAYIRTVSFGQNVIKDIDGDGERDIIEAELHRDMEYGEVTLRMFINGEDVSDAFSREGIYLTDGIEEEFYLIDLNEDTPEILIAISDNGPSADPATYIFAYDGKGLHEIGQVSDLMSNDTVQIQGDGTLQCAYPLYMIETVRTIVTYRVNEAGQLELIPQEWYVTDERYVYEEEKGHAILRPVTVYQENSIESEQVVLTPEDGKVELPATDGIEWVQVQMEDGRIYYLHMAEEMVIDSAGLELYPYEVFADLRIAG